jgi:hypothetical protein
MQALKNAAPRMPDGRRGCSRASEIIQIPLHSSRRRCER